MKKAKIYSPNKSAMQSGLNKTGKWILEFETKNPTKNPLMGWESSSDTLSEVKLEFSSLESIFLKCTNCIMYISKVKFSSKELAINYAKKKKIDFDLIEPKKRKVVKKAYADNFLK